MWYYINDKNHVVGSNPNDMSNNSGWIENSKTIDNLTDENGIALYKFVDGEVVKRDQKEMMVVNIPTPVKDETGQSIEEKITVLEEELKSLKEQFELKELS